jgi:hypothetical protein
VPCGTPNGPVADPGLHGVQQPPVATELLSEGAIANERGMGETAKRAAHWVMAPRRCAGSGPWSAGSARWRWACPRTPSPQVRAILDAPEQMADVRPLSRADARGGRQPGHPDASRRQRGAGRAHPGAELVVISVPHTAR